MCPGNHHSNSRQTPLWALWVILVVQILQVVKAVHTVGSSDEIDTLFFELAE